MTTAVIDIETIARVVPGLEAKLMEEAKAPSNWKDQEKIAARKKEYVEKKLENFHFQADGAEMIAVGMGLVHPRGQEVMQMECRVSSDENELAKFFCDYCNENQVTKLVGWNIEKFDLPIITRAVAHSPYYLNRPIGKWDVCDLMDWLKRKESFNRRLKGSFDSITSLLGIEAPDISGDAVAKLWEEERFQEIRDYCLSDVDITGRVYMKLSKVHAL